MWSQSVADDRLRHRVYALTSASQNLCTNQPSSRDSRFGPVVTKLKLQPNDTIHVYLLARTALRCQRAYILPLWFFLSFFFFRRRISEVTERISTKVGHVFTYDCYLKNLVWTPPGFSPHGLGAKNAFLGPALNFDQTYLCNGTWYQQSERNLSIYMTHIWWTLVQKRLRTVGGFLPTPKLSHWEPLPALLHGRHITVSRQTLARVT